MKPNPAFTTLRNWRVQGWLACATALVCFAAGSLLTQRLTRPAPVRADNNRVFELMIYHTLPGKEPALESVFRDVAKLQAKHDLSVIGYWVPQDVPGWENTFIYLVAQPSREEAQQHWKALHADTAFPPYRQEAGELIEKAGDEYRVDEVYMRPTEYSAMK